MNNIGSLWALIMGFVSFNYQVSEVWNSWQTLLDDQFEGDSSKEKGDVDSQSVSIINFNGVGGKGQANDQEL